MKKETEEVIKKIAQHIDKDKYNPILTSKDYDKYLEEILLIMVKGILEIEKS